MVGRFSSFAFIALSMVIALTGGRFGGVLGLLILWFGGLVGPDRDPDAARPAAGVPAVWPGRRRSSPGRSACWSSSSPGTWSTAGSRSSAPDQVTAVHVGGPVICSLIVFVLIGLIRAVARPGLRRAGRCLGQGQRRGRCQCLTQCRCLTDGLASHHLVDDVLGWWMTHGPDPEYGGVLTCWDNAGTTARVDGQVHLVAGPLDLADGPRGPPGAAARSRRGAGTAASAIDRRLRPRSRAPAGRQHRLRHRPAGAPNEPVAGQGVSVSVFADLFVALGFAGLAAHDPTTLGPSRPSRSCGVPPQRIADGTFRSEPYPVPEGRSSFALPMILIGVGEQVHRATGSARSLEIVREAVAAIETAFVTGRRRGRDAAYRGPDGSLLGPAPDARGTCSRRSGSCTTRGTCWRPARWPRTPIGPRAVAGHALELGWDDRHGGLFRYVDAGGGPPSGRRTDDPYEALVVDDLGHQAVVAARRGALHDRAARARRPGPGMHGWHERLRDYTLGPVPGRAWAGVDPDPAPGRRPLDETVALPVKDPFHIARALLLLVELDHDRPCPPPATSTPPPTAQPTDRGAHMNATVARMPVIRVFPDRQALGRAAAADVAADLRRRLAASRTSCMIFAAAPSQREMLDHLVAADGIDWSRVTAFHMDEYLGLPDHAPAAVRRVAAGGAVRPPALRGRARHRARGRPGRDRGAVRGPAGRGADRRRVLRHRPERTPRVQRPAGRGPRRPGATSRSWSSTTPAGSSRSTTAASRGSRTSRLQAVTLTIPRLLDAAAGSPASSRARAKRDAVVRALPAPLSPRPPGDRAAHPPRRHALPRRRVGSAAGRPGRR